MPRIEIEKKGKTEAYVLNSRIDSSEVIEAKNGKHSYHRLLLEDKTEIRFPRLAKIIIDPVRKGDEIELKYPRKAEYDGETKTFSDQTDMSVTRNGKPILELPISESYVVKPL